MRHKEKERERKKKAETGRVAQLVFIKCKLLLYLQTINNKCKL